MSNPPHEDKPRQTALGRKLTNSRKTKGYSQARVAQIMSERVGREINPGRISEYEQGKRTPPGEVLRILTVVLEIDDTDPPNSGPQATLAL